MCAPLDQPASRPRARIALVSITEGEVRKVLIGTKSEEEKVKHVKKLVFSIASYRLLGPYFMHLVLCGRTRTSDPNRSAFLPAARPRPSVRLFGRSATAAAAAIAPFQEASSSSSPAGIISRVGRPDGHADG